MDAVHLLGFSTGAPMAVMYAALFPEKIAAMGLQGPPLDFHTEGGMFSFRELIERLDTKKLVDVYGNVPTEFLDLTPESGWIFCANSPVRW